MKSPADSHEITILESKGILIQDQIFHAVLTDRRIILTRYSDNKLSIRSIYFADIQKIEKDTDDSGDPVIILVPSSAKREIKKVGLHFSQKNFPDPHKESSLWASEINKMLRSASRVPPAPVPKKPPVTKAFCVRCGTKCTDGSAFCTKCGTKIIYPAHSLPPRQIDTSVRKGVKIIEIPVEKIELPHKKSSIPNTNDSHKKEKVPVVAPKHKEHEKKKSFLPDSDNENLH
jgi:DNA-directed RNA polymerase subunit RPC12/RpoP